MPDADNLDESPESFPLVETLAERLFYAEMGHTGMTWDSLSVEFGQEDYRRKVSRMLEGLYRTDEPRIVLDLGDDLMWWAHSLPARSAFSAAKDALFGAMNLQLIEVNDALIAAEIERRRLVQEVERLREIERWARSLLTGLDRYSDLKYWWGTCGERHVAGLHAALTPSVEGATEKCSDRARESEAEGAYSSEVQRLRMALAYLAGPDAVERELGHAPTFSVHPPDPEHLAEWATGILSTPSVEGGAE